MYNQFGYDNDMYGTDRPGSFRPRNGMEKAAFSLGVVSLVCSSAFYISLPCGAMSILCALLSRTKKSRTLSRRCRISVILAACGIIVSSVITGTVLHSTLTNPQLRRYLEYYLQAYTGDSSLRLEDILPFYSEPEQEEQPQENDLEESAPPEDSVPPSEPSDTLPQIPNDSKGVFL